MGDNDLIIHDSEGNIQVLDSEGNNISQSDGFDILKTQGDDLTYKIISEDDPEELNKLSQLFTLNQKKKQIARTNKLSNLLDKVDDEVISRIEKAPYLIEDSDLLKYWSTTSNAVNGRTDEDNSIPKIQINANTNINVNSSGLNRESRERVLEVVNQILKEASNQNDVIDVEVKEK